MSIYAQQVKEGRPITDLDNMDFPGYLKILAFMSRKRVKKVFIDDVL